MVKIQQTIIIGLGSSGRKTLEHFKARLNKRYGELPAIKLLALDVLSPADGQTATLISDSLLGPTECLEIPLDPIIGQARLAQEAYPWVSDRVVTYGPDWYKTRAAARVAFQSHSKDIISFLEFQLHQLGTVEVRDEMASKGFETAGSSSIIIAGLGDVCGSALLVDLAYLINHLFQRVGSRVSSSAMLYMPGLVPSDPLAEARSYAALKELSAFLDGRVYHCDYPELKINADIPPFDKGCFLIDTCNEKNLTLHDQEEAIYLTAEWLFRSVTSSLKSRVDEYVADQLMVRSLNPMAPFNSLGLATYVLPIDALIEWSSTRLSIDLIQSQLLKPEFFSRVSSRLTDYYNKTSLRPNSLMNEKLRLGKDGKPIKLQNEYISRLSTVPYDQITSQVQKTVDDIGKKILPGLKKQIDLNAKAVLQEVEEVISQEIVSILHEWPAGGLRLASQFTNRLKQDAQTFSESLSRREAALQARNRQLINNLNQLGPLLRNAVAGIPNIFVLILAFLGGLISPVLLISIWIWQGFQKSPSLAAALIVVTWLLALASVFFAFWRSKNAIGEVRDQYVVQLNKRFEVELSLTLIQAASSLYPDIINVAKLERDHLDTWIQDLRDTTRSLRLRLADIPLSGEINFALQRSVLSEDSAAELYDKFLGPGQTDAHLNSFIVEKGDLASWLDRPLADFKNEILDYSVRAFAGLRGVRVEELLKGQMTSQTKTERLIQELEDKSAPLWTYDAFALGQDFNPVLKVFVGMDPAVNQEFKQNFTKVNQSIIFESIDDPFSLIVTSIRCNMPLFGLGRMQEFRKHYLQIMQNKGEPLHLEDELALSSDIIRAPNQRAGLEPATALAVGLALGLIKREDGIFVVVDLQGKIAGKLSIERIDSAVLLGAKEQLLQSLTEDIQKTASMKGIKASEDELNKYISQADISKWETVRIEQYIALLES